MDDRQGSIYSSISKQVWISHPKSDLVFRANVIFIEGRGRSPGRSASWQHSWDCTSERDCPGWNGQEREKENRRDKQLMWECRNKEIIGWNLKRTSVLCRRGSRYIGSLLYWLHLLPIPSRPSDWAWWTLWCVSQQMSGGFHGAPRGVRFTSCSVWVLTPRCLVRGASPWRRVLPWQPAPFPGQQQKWNSKILGSDISTSKTRQNFSWSSSFALRITSALNA